MDNNLLPLQNFNTITDAAIYKSVLEEHGIEAVIFDENTSTVYPIFGQAFGGIRLMVKEQDFEQARKILEDLDITSEEE
jgi:hypothetical protein